MDGTQRWRLVLGRYSERHLPTPSGLAGRMDIALDQLYGRLYLGRGVRPGTDLERGASLDTSAVVLVDWLDTVHELFPADVCERVERDALQRFGLTGILTDPRALAKVSPSLELAKLLMAMRQRLPAGALGDPPHHLRGRRRCAEPDAAAGGAPVAGPGGPSSPDPAGHRSGRCREDDRTQPPHLGR